jgi:hypothetical protein
MERQAHNSLYEAALQVQSPDATDDDAARFEYKTSDPRHPDHQENFPNHPMYDEKEKKKYGINRDHVEYDEVEMPDMVLEYFNNYFGDNLTEDTTNEDIMEAVYDLIDLTEVVLSSVGLQEVAPLAWHMRAKFSPKMDHTMDDARKSRWKYLEREKKRKAGTQVVTTADGRIKRIKNRNRGPGETTIKGSWRDRKGDVGVPPKPETKHPSQTAKPPATPPRPAPKPETFRGRSIPPKTFSSKPKLAPKILQQGTKGKPVLQQGTKGKPGYIKLTPKNK